MASLAVFAWIGGFFLFFRFYGWVNKILKIRYDPDQIIKIALQYSEFIYFTAIIYSTILKNISLTEQEEPVGNPRPYSRCW